MANEFKVGDVVKLKSGGPEMTIEGIVYDENVTCSWFDGCKLRSGSFNIRAIQHLIKEPEPVIAKPVRHYSREQVIEGPLGNVRRVMPLCGVQVRNALFAVDPVDVTCPECMAMMVTKND